MVKGSFFFFFLMRGGNFYFKCFRVKETLKTIVCFFFFFLAICLSNIEGIIIL